MKRYFYSILFLLFVKYSIVLGDTVCDHTSVRCEDYTSSNYYFYFYNHLDCYLLNNNTELIRSQLKECIGNSSSSNSLYVYKNFISNVIGGLVIDIDIPPKIKTLILFNYRDDDYFRLNTSIEHSALTRLYIFETVIVESNSFFNYFPALRTIYLRKIISPETPSFTNLHNLTYFRGIIEVLGDPILDNDMVRGLSKLETLYLDNSNFEKLDSNAFENLENLNILSLQDNKITQIQDGTFEYLSKLRYLYLEGNEITSVNNNVFKALNGLQYLYLSRNPNFPIETLIYTRKLIVLSLNYNDYPSLDPYVFQQMNKLTSLYLDNNPFVCDCDLWWISKLAENGVYVSGKCFIPYNASGRAITDRTSLYGDCDQSESYECFNRSKTCRSHEFCYNKGKIYNCGCIKGYTRLNSGECLEDNECDRLDRCQHSCVNTNGSYYCNCDKGYKLLPNGYSCEDVNECEDSKGGCEAGCSNTIGSYQCYCEFGHRVYNETKCAGENEYALISEQFNLLEKQILGKAHISTSTISLISILSLAAIIIVVETIIVIMIFIYFTQKNKKIITKCNEQIEKYEKINAYAVKHLPLPAELGKGAKLSESSIIVPDGYSNPIYFDKHQEKSSKPLVNSYEQTVKDKISFLSLKKDTKYENLDEPPNSTENVSDHEHMYESMT